MKMNGKEICTGASWAWHSRLSGSCDVLYGCREFLDKNGINDHHTFADRIGSDCQESRAKRGRPRKGGAK